MKKVKKIAIKTGVLLLVFIAAVFVSSMLQNTGTDDQTISMGEPMLPRVSFQVEGHTVNTLSGYVEEMDVTAMRDTITPVQLNGKLEMQIETDGAEITGISYEALSLDGQEQYVAGSAEMSGGEDQEQPVVTLEVAKALSSTIPEAVLKVTLQADGRDVYYYTRIERIEDRSINECMSFAKDFHDKTFDAGSAEELEQYLEANEESDNTTLQTVNIHSNVAHIQWGSLAPQVSTEVEWSIKECNTVYTSLLARYQVTCEGDGGEVETYNIREFFRVRCSEGEMYLLDYNRTMNQIFNGTKSVIDKKGILLGMTGEDVNYRINAAGTIVAFVQERDLWTYNKSADELSLVFSFSNMEGQDARSRNDEHDVRIISMDDDGNMVFAVYGYMNRGEHEGTVGVDIYYFDISENAIEEKAFIPSTKSYAIAADELGRMVYFNQAQQRLYVLAGGTLYQVDLEEDEQTSLAENLEEGQYVVSDDGELIAFQTEGGLNTAAEVEVLDLSSAESYQIQAPDGEAVRPLGFVNEDFICGYVRESDRGSTVAGEEFLPMYKLEIRDASGAVVKTYEQEGIYLTDILIEDSLVTLNRVTNTDGIYTGTTQDYITSNEEREETDVTLESFSTDLKEKQMRFTFADGIEELAPRILRPKQVMHEQALTISFDDGVKTDKYYVYGMGELVAVYDKAAYAIQKAEQVSGVVISSEQSYIWEKGNQDLVYSTGAEAFGKAEGQTSLDACTAYMERYEAKRIDLTGCTLDQVLYIINKGRPMIAMTDAAHAILLTGYTTTDVTYIDPDDGAEHTVDMDTMNAMVAGSGNTFIGYVK